MIKPGEVAPAKSAAEIRLARTEQIAWQYRRSQVYGLLLIAAIILGVAVYRAQPGSLFPPGWWR
jgi:hypothetical protein